MMLSLAGGIMGGIAAVGMTRLLVRFPAASGFIDGSIPPRVFIEGVLMAIVVGILGGLYPAVRASQLLPTEALRHD